MDLNNAKTTDPIWKVVNKALSDLEQQNAALQSLNTKLLERTRTGDAAYNELTLKYNELVMENKKLRCGQTNESTAQKADSPIKTAATEAVKESSKPKLSPELEKILRAAIGPDFDNAEIEFVLL